MTPKFTPSNTAKTIRILADKVGSGTINEFDTVALVHVLSEYAYSCEQLESWQAQPTPEQPTLRDWLAMHASEEDIQEFIPQTVGEQERRFKQDGIRRTRTWARYQAADAMLAARKGVQL